MIFFYSVQLLYYKCHKVSFKRGGSYIDPPDWTKNKAKNNAEDEDDGCFPYAATVALNYEELMWNP